MVDLPDPDSPAKKTGNLRRRGAHRKVLFAVLAVNHEGLIAEEQETGWRRLNALSTTTQVTSWSPKENCCNCTNFKKPGQTGHPPLARGAPFCSVQYCFSFLQPDCTVAAQQLTQFLKFSVILACQVVLYFYRHFQHSRDVYLPT